jgi:hypothetical protein
MLDRLSSALNIAGNFGVSANGSRIEICTQRLKGQLLLSTMPRKDKKLLYQHSGVETL